MEGFEKRRQEKLDNIFEPQNVQIFDVEKSRYLYDVVTKQAAEIKAEENRWNEKRQRKNKQFQPLVNNQNPNNSLQMKL